MGKIPSVCYSVPSSLPKPTFFAYDACIKGKFTKHIKGFYCNDTNLDKLKPRCHFQMNYAFIRGPMKDRRRGHL